MVKNMPSSNCQHRSIQQATPQEHQVPQTHTTTLPTVTLFTDSLLALQASLLLAVLTLAGTLEELDHTLMNTNLGPPMSSSTPGGSAGEPSTTSGQNESFSMSSEGMLPNSSQWQPTRDHSNPSMRRNARLTAMERSSEHSTPIASNSSTTYQMTSTSLGRHTQNQGTSQGGRRRRRTRSSNNQAQCPQTPPPPFSSNDFPILDILRVTQEVMDGTWEKDQMTRMRR